jgi:hypothetical protein
MRHSGPAVESKKQALMFMMTVFGNYLAIKHEKNERRTRNHFENFQSLEISHRE